MRTGFDPDDYKIRSFLVNVEPLLYQTWRFYAVIAVLLMLFVWAFVRWHNRMTVRKNKNLGNLVNKKNESILMINKALREQSLLPVI